MLTLFLCAQLAAAPPIDSTYATAALRQLVARAAKDNQFPPAALKSYRSRIETELSILVRDTLGRERSAEIEQLATDAMWTRGDRYDLHIVGYRAQNIGVPYSTLSLVRAWTVPTLYGDRLSLGAYFSRARRGDTLLAVHPFAKDRDEYYRFTGGDTIATLRTPARTISVVRIHAHPNLRGSTRLGAFDGEIDLDAERAQIIRMRGQFVVIGGVAGRRATIAQRIGVVAAAYVEFVNAEIAGAYWLPTFQRTEFQASFPLLGQSRPVFRLVSTIASISVTDTGAVADEGPTIPRVSIGWASPDSLSAFRGWQHDIGVLSSSVSADDFDDVAPDSWRLDGPPRVDLFPSTMSRVLRFNRVEGLFTGLAPTLTFRSWAPGLAAGAFGGWAWTEQTARGGVFVSYRHANTVYGVRAERALVSTNDFGPPLDDDPGFGALLGSVDNNDYVDRRSTMLSATRIIGSVDRGLATIQVGVTNDHAERARLAHGLFAGGAAFRPNRGVVEGTSFVAAGDLELHPNVTGDFVQPGVGARFHIEAGRGDLAWTRTELDLLARKYFGPISLAAVARGGAVSARVIPPQKLFELGGVETLPGYEYKQFAGNRAALFRTFASYRLGIWQRPHRFWRNYLLPGLSPGVGASMQGGWTELSTPSALAAAGLLGGNTLPIPRATSGMRATAGAGIMLFSDIVHVGIARPIDRAARLRLVAGFGTAF